MNVPAALGLIFDPTHESPDVIDQRPPNDPTRAQTGGTVPISVNPGAGLPIDTSADIPMVTILKGWNIWDVYQSQAPIDPTPGSLDQQLADWVRAAAHLEPDAPIARVSSNAAAQVLATRSSFPDLNHPLDLGTGGSAVFKRTVAFENSGDRLSVLWPHDMNYMLDAAYIPAPAPASPLPQPTPGAVPTSPAPTPPSSSSSSSSSAPMLILGAGLAVILLLRGKRKRR